MRSMVYAAGLALMTCPAFALPLTQGLQGYWQFNGTGADASGHGRPMNLFGNAGYGGGLLGQALSLDGAVASFAARPVNDAAFDLGGADFTIQIWAKFNRPVAKVALPAAWWLVRCGGSDANVAQGQNPASMLTSPATIEVFA